MPNQLRIAIAGLGKIAGDQHLPAIAASPDFVLAAVATKGDVPPGLQVPVFDDHRTMLRDVPDLHAVAVCTPPGIRPVIARDALLAGKHVLLEKPTAATLTEAEALAEVARRGGRTVFATWHSRFNPAAAVARTLLAGQKVTRLDVQWREDVEKWHPGQDWVWRPGGFGVFDPGINALSVLTAIMPSPLAVRSCRVLVQPGHDMPIAASLRFATADGEGDLSAEFDWRPSPDIRTMEIETADGPRLSFNSVRRLAVDGVEQAVSGDGEYKAVYARFAELIAAGQSELDLAPLRLVADAFLLATREAG